MVILLSSALVSFSGTHLKVFYLTLTLLGVGWNFTFIAATTLLANSHEPFERGRAQGLNDMFVFGFVAIASLASGVLMNCTGGNSAEGWALVNIAVMPLVLISVVVLTIFKVSTKEIKSSNY